MHSLCISGKLLKQTLRGKNCSHTHTHTRTHLRVDMTVKCGNEKVCKEKRNRWAFQEVLWCIHHQWRYPHSLSHISQFTKWYDIWIYHFFTSMSQAAAVWSPLPRSFPSITKRLRMLRIIFALFLTHCHNEFSNFSRMIHEKKEHNIIFALRLLNTNV